jgi:putative sigma-54 modulation protein
MQTPLQLTFRSLAHSDALAAHVQRRVEKLEHLFDRIISCHVVVELASHRHRHGDECRVTVNVGLPGHELLASHAPSGDRILDLHATADRAFDDAERQLEDWARRRREDRHGGVTPPAE